MMISQTDCRKQEKQDLDTSSDLDRDINSAISTHRFSQENINEKTTESFVTELVAQLEGFEGQINCMALMGTTAINSVQVNTLFLGSQTHIVTDNDGELKTVCGNLYIVDIKDIANPKIIDRFPSDTRDMVVWEQWLISISINGLICVYDMSAPTEPILILQHQHLQRIDKMILENSESCDLIPSLFIKTFDQGFTQLDLFALPNNLKVGAMINTSVQDSSMASLSISNEKNDRFKRLFYYSENNRLSTALLNGFSKKFDIQDANNLQLDSPISAISLNNRMLLLATRDGQFYSIPYSSSKGIGYFDPKRNLIPSISLDAEINSIQIHSRLAIVIGRNVLAILDISNSRCLVEMYHLKLDSPIKDVEVVDSHLLVQTLNGLSIYHLNLLDEMIVD